MVFRADHAVYMTLQVNRIQRFCLHDGPGIRSVLFVQGCHLRCPWCHNPETWRFGDGTATDPAALAAELLREQPWWERSGGGVTISGGEILDQADAVAVLLRHLGKAGVHRAIETSGDGPPGALAVIAPHAELWLIDLKHGDAALLERRTKVRLPVVLRAVDELLARGAAVVARIPLIGGFNDGDGALDGLVGLCRSRPGLSGIELLPGHDHEKGGRAVHASTPRERLEAAVAAFSATGIPTRIVQ